MADYISREAALSFPFANGQYDHENANEHFINGCESYKEWLEQLPAADVRPVVRGQWEIKGDFAYCTVCKEGLRLECGVELFDKMPNFCPNCGADCQGGNDGK